jgi:hypothetical protein
MNSRRVAGIVLASVGCCLAATQTAAAQCCLTDLFSGCLAGCRKPPVYAVAPVAPVPAPIIAPIAAPPPPPQPVMVPVQQTSYVPETTYRTEYKCVPVTSYKPSCEIDPCTGCPVDCMQPVTQYVQQAVNVPVTQYRAVTTTRYVQMQPGSAGPAAMAPPAAPVGPSAASPFTAVQTTPQAWGAAGADVSRQPLPGVTPPALPPGSNPPAPTYQQYQPVAPPGYGGQPSPQTITPQAGTYAPAAPQATPQPQPTQPPALAPAPSLKPIPERPRTDTATGGAAGDAAGRNRTNGEPTSRPSQNGAAPAPGSAGDPNGSNGPARMPVLPGTGPGAASGAFPRLLEPTSHTTSWGPSDGASARVQYPTAALPAWRQGQR